MELLTQSLSSLSGQSFGIGLVVVFLAGVATSLSPCVLPVLPLIIGYMGGYGPGDRRSVLMMSSALVAGLTVTLIGFGLASAFLGMIFGRIGGAWYAVIGLLLVVMGLHLLGLIKVRIPGFDIRLGEKAKRGPLGAFLAGLAFGLVTSSCGTPILVGVLSYASLSGSLLLGSLILAVYGVGRGVVLLALAAGTGLASGIKRLQPYSEAINRVSGILLVIMGIYIIYTNLL